VTDAHAKIYLQQAIRALLMILNSGTPEQHLWAAQDILRLCPGWVSK